MDVQSDSVQSQADTIAQAIPVASGTDSTRAEPSAPDTATASLASLMLTASPAASTTAINDPSASSQSITTAAATDGTVVPSQADTPSDVPSADSSGLAEPRPTAIVLPTQPSLVHDSTADGLPVVAVPAAPRTNALQPATANISKVLTLDVGDRSAPSVVTRSDNGASFAVQPEVSAAQGLQIAESGTVATKLMRTVVINIGPWAPAVPSASELLVSPLGTTSTNPKETAQDQMKTAVTGRAGAHDTVLAGGLVLRSPSTASWLPDTADVPGRRHSAHDPESGTDAVDDVWATYSDEPYEV